MKQHFVLNRNWLPSENMVIPEWHPVKPELAGREDVAAGLPLGASCRDVSLLAASCNAARLGPGDAG